MKLTVVGYWGGYPAAGEATSGYLLQQDNFNLLIDCGSAVVSNIQRYIKIENLNGVIISHYHHDHVADIGPLQYACLIKSKLGQFTGVLDIYGHPFDMEGFKKLTMEPYTRGISYDGEKIISIGPFNIEFIKTKHPVICYGMKISAGNRKIVYTADSSFEKKFIDFSRGADLLVCECNLYSGQDGSSAGHMNSRDAGIISNDAAVKKLLLTHLPHYGDYNMLIMDAKKHYTGEIELAKAGWIWEG